MKESAHVAVLMAVFATFALDVYSSFCSSPQTTEINASVRADTLMKWVVIGDVVAIGGGVAGTIVAKSPWPLIAAGGVALSMHLLYTHARDRGLEQGGPGTESW